LLYWKKGGQINSFSWRGELVIGVCLWYKLAAPRKAFFWPTFVMRLLTLRSRKSGYGLLLGCRSGFDLGPFENTFFWQSSNPKTGKIFTLCFGSLSQSIGCGRISREGALDHRESRERRDKIFAAKTENAKIFKKKMDQENSFQWGIFIFLAAGKLTFLGGV